jgi:hypothetical protein
MNMNMNMKTHEGLLAALDAPRGQDPWNGGPRPTLRAIFVREGAYNPGEPRWRWYAGCTPAARRASPRRRSRAGSGCARGRRDPRARERAAR